MDVADLTYAVRVIREGGIVAYPTESCYGLGCDPRQHASIRRLLHLKRRSWEQGLILIGARFTQLARYIDASHRTAIERAQATWPGPHTWVLPALPRVSPWIRGRQPGIAVRVTAHRGAAALCGHVRLALVSTSANRHGRPPARSALAVRREFGDGVDFILPGRLDGLDSPTEIRDGVTNRVLRPAGDAP